jgi:hypothetical protein
MGGFARGAAGEALAPPLFKYLVAPVGGGIAKVASHVPGLNTLAQKLMGPTNKLIPGAAEAQQQLTARGESLTAGQASNSSLIQTLEGIAEGSYGGSGVMETARAGAQRAARQDIDDFAAAFANHPDKSVRAKGIQTTLDGEVDAFRANAKTRYKAIDDALEAGGATGVKAVDIRQTLLQAQQELADIQLPGSSAKLVKVLDDVLRPRINNIRQARPDALTFKEAQQLRSELRAYSSDSTDPLKTKTDKVVKDLLRSLDGAIDDAGARLPEDVVPLYRAANQFWKEGQERFNNDFIKKIVAMEEPEVLFEAAVRNGRPTHIRQLKEALRDAPDFDAKWNEVQGQWLGEVLEASKVEDTVLGSVLSGKRLVQNIRAFGEEANQALFGRDLQPLQHMARTLELAEKSTAAGGLSGRGIRLIQGQGAFTLALGAGGLPYASDPAATGTAMGMVFGPAALAILMRDPRFVSMLAMGLKSPAGSRAAARMMSQLLTRADQLGVLDKPAMPQEEVAATPSTIEGLEEARVLGKGAPGGMRESTTPAAQQLLDMRAATKGGY